jgi:cytochrome c553
METAAGIVVLLRVQAPLSQALVRANVAQAGIVGVEQLELATTLPQAQLLRKNVAGSCWCCHHGDEQPW